MRIDAFRPAADFKQHMDQWIERFRSAKTAEGFSQVLIPGDPEREMEAERSRNGIPLLGPVVDDLRYLSERFEIGMTVQEWYLLTVFCGVVCVWCVVYVYVWYVGVILTLLVCVHYPDQGVGSEGNEWR